MKFTYCLNLTGSISCLFYTGVIAPYLIWHKKKIVLFIVENEKGVMKELMCNVQMGSVERKMAGRKER